MIDLSIIVPCLDEEENVALVLDSISDLISKTDISYEIILVDDQSEDLTLSIAEQWKKGKKILKNYLYITKIWREKRLWRCCKIRVSIRNWKICNFCLCRSC